MPIITNLNIIEYNYNIVKFKYKQIVKNLTKCK